MMKRTKDAVEHPTQKSLYDVCDTTQDTFTTEAHSSSPLGIPRETLDETILPRVQRSESELLVC